MDRRCDNKGNGIFRKNEITPKFHLIKEGEKVKEVSLSKRC